MTITDTDIEFIHSKIQPLIGMKAWNVFRQFGSYLYFDFGDFKITGFGHEKGESRLVILDCSWRIETADGVLTGWADVHPIMDKVVKQLEDQTIISFTVAKPSLDTAIVFKNGLTLRLFPIANSETHWFFEDGDFTLSLDNGASYRYYNHNENFPVRPPKKDEPPTPIGEADIQAVQAILDSLVGKKITEVKLGYMENPVISFKEKGVKSTQDLMLLNLDWRLETDTEYISGSLQPYRGYKQLDEYLKKKRVLAVEITPPAFDTTFIFKDNLKLRFFGYTTQRGTQYTLEMPDKRTLYVGPNTKWSIKEPYRTKKSRS